MVTFQSVIKLAQPRRSGTKTAIAYNIRTIAGRAGMVSRHGGLRETP
jgi:hypothetical protein